MDLENKEEMIQPLSEEEMEQVSGGEIYLDRGAYLYCDTCDIRYYKPEDINCFRCGKLLKYHSGPPVIPLG